VAVSRDGHHWFLLNASPDVREQLARLPENVTPSALRHVPIEGVLLTDAEIDHSLGIVLLREAQFLPLYSTSAVYSLLEDASHVLPVVRAFADMPWTELPIERAVVLPLRDGTPSGLSVEPFVVPAGPPRFATAAERGHTVGLMIRDSEQERTCAYVPACGELTTPVLERLVDADVLLFDGTFWSDDEPRSIGISRRTAHEMDHLPIGNDDGSLTRLAGLACRHRIYTHINNTNPILLEDSPERAAVTAAGLIVGDDGMHIQI
jgi:pyrroloquinoline quinone biosynthesis protein B